MRKGGRAQPEEREINDDGCKFMLRVAGASRGQFAACGAARISMDLKPNQRSCNRLRCVQAGFRFN